MQYLHGNKRLVALFLFFINGFVMALALSLERGTGHGRRSAGVSYTFLPNRVGFVVTKHVKHRKIRARSMCENIMPFSSLCCLLACLSFLLPFTQAASCPARRGGGGFGRLRAKSSQKGGFGLLFPLHVLATNTHTFSALTITHPQVPEPCGPFLHTPRVLQ